MKKYKAFFTTSLNNAGYDRVGNISDMVYNSGDLETLGRGSRATQAMSLSAKTAGLSEDRTRFNNAEMATLSTIFPLSPKTKLKLVGFLGFDELKAYQNSYSVTYFGTTYFENTESNNSASNIKKGYVNAFFNYDVSATKMLQLSSVFNSGNSDFKNDLTFNGVSTREQLETKSTYFDQKLTYTHKWKERNVVLLKGRFFTDKLPQYYTINDYLMGDLFPYENINAIDNNIGSQKEYAGLEADFKLKQKNGDLLEFTAGFDNSNDNLSTQFRLFTDGGNITPDGYQSDSGYNVGDLYARSGYKFKFDKVSLGIHADAHQLFNRFENIQGEVKKQNPFFINPFLTAGWEISPDNSISANYRYNFRNVGLLQVNDAYILNSSRSFSKGLGYFDQLENWSAGLSYSTRHYLNRYGLTAGIDYSKQNDAIAYRSSIDQNSSLSEAFLIKAGDRIAATVRTHYVIRKLKGTVGFDASLSRLVYYNEVNGSDLRKNTSYNQIYGLNWASNFKSFFNFKLGTEWTLSNVKSDHNFNSSYAFSFLDLDFAVSKQFTVKTKTEYYFFGGEGINNSYFFADAEANYSFAKDKYTIGLDARNLFDTRFFTTYSVSDIGYASNSYKLLPRYVLLTFKFRF